jgi:hypothetical protein
MLGFCALVLANICAPSQYAPVVRVTAMYHGAHMDNRNARAHVNQARTESVADVLLSDNVVSVPVFNLDKACGETVCVYYRRHCTSELACRYEVAVMEKSRADLALEVTMRQKVLLSASSPEELRSLQRGITFVLATDEARNIPAGRVGMADLTRESSDTDLSKLVSPLPLPSMWDLGNHVIQL